MNILDFNFEISNFEENVIPENFKDKIISLIQEILNEQFSIFQKRKIRIKRDRLNFSCPYCGDSATDSSKKRGNLYLKNLSVYCYNCNHHTSLQKFLKDFGKSLVGNDLVYAKKLQEENKQFLSHRQQIDNSFFFDETILDEFAIDKRVIFEAYNLIEINHPQANWIRKYLEDRLQTNFSNFGWDKERNRLFIFNFTSSGKVLGFQIRNFKQEPKYITKTLQILYEELGIEHEKEDEESEFEEVNRLSFLFGLSTTDFKKPVFAFEGPLDSFLISNAISTCGTNNELPFFMSNLYFIYDKDKPGTKKSIEKLNAKCNVFLWSKFLKAIEYPETSKKIDFTDIMKWSIENNVELPSLLGFFGNHPLDIWEL